MTDGNNKITIHNLNKNSIIHIQDSTVLLTTFYNNTLPIEINGDITLIESCNIIKTVKAHNNILINNNNIKITLTD